MGKILLILFLSLFISCNEPKEKHPTKKDYTLAILAIVNNFSDSCLSDYGTLNPLFTIYYNDIFSSYPISCETVIIGDSTMDLSRQTTFYDSVKTYNYSVSGNTACDYLQQMEYVKCQNPKNILIATADGNGVLRGVSSSASISTIEKVINRSRVKWNPEKIIVIGIHPVLVTSANTNKNSVNNGVSQIPNICYINPLPIWGATETDNPRVDWMIDSIHYQSNVYDLYKTQILNQCGVGL